VKITIEKFLIIKKNLKPHTKMEVMSGSMAPFIHAGDMLEVSPCEMKDLVLGDIIIFWRDSILISHMIVRIQNKDGEYLLYTKGLSTSKEDAPTNKNNYLGVVVSPTPGPIRKKLIILFLKYRDLFKKKPEHKAPASKK